MGVTGYTIADEVDAMRHVIEGFHALDRNNMGLIVCEIIIREDSRLHGLEIRAFLEFDIYHAAMDTGA